MTAKAEPIKPDTVHVADLDHFVQILTAWHTQKVKVLEHMLSIPAGSEMAIDGETPVILEGDMLAGLKAGIGLALMELGSLPFAAETEPVEAANDPTGA